jgi:YegS/Rv2252/BmrU family lipid kinase
MNKVLYIINPISGVGKQKIIEKLLQKYSDPNLIKYDIIYTERAKHAITISRREATNYDAIIAVGGDGSVNEVAQSLVGTDTALGVIPTGSGNGFARHVKLPLNLDKAILRINEFNTEMIDIGSINNIYFVNVAGIGFDALITHKFANHGKRGFSSYIKLTTKEFSKYKGQDINIKVNGETINKNVFLLTVANGSQYGNNAFIAPKASMQDGLLDIAILNQFPLISSPILAYRLFTKKFEKFKHANCFKAKSIIISQSKNIKAQIDGEPINFEKEVEIKVIEKALKIIV